jgi:hypothetical protein
MNYFRGARVRAGRRRSPWNLVLLAIVLCNLALLLGIGLYAVNHLHQYVHPGQSLETASGVAVIVATVSVLFAAIPVSLLVANAQARKVPALRRTLDAEASSHKGTDYWSSQKALIKVALLVAPVCLGLATTASLLPWRQ